MMNIYRIQDRHGRGPWRPGFSDKWVIHRDDHENLPAWIEQFGLDILPRVQWGHYGCGCRTIDQLRRWIERKEYETLLAYGYKAVRMNVDRILAESDIQLVFQRARPLRENVESIDLYAPNSAPSDMRICDESLYRI